MDKDTIFSTIIQKYPAKVRSNTPTGVDTLAAMLSDTGNPKPKILEVFQQIAQAAAEGNIERKKYLKQNNLYYYTPCVYIDKYRKYANILKFTGLLVGDFDHVEDAQGLKEALFNEYKCIIAAYISPSRKGVKIIVKIPVVETVEQFKEYYYGLAAELDYIEGFDSCGKNAVLPLFQSYDPDILIRPNPDTWTTKGIQQGDVDKVKPTPPVKIDVTDREKQWILNIIESGFRNITNVGHPNLRALCVVIGGYISNGYIAESEALGLIDSEITNHSYLKKGVTGYCKTARSAVRYGMSKPLILGK